jgi:dolichyl-phosphate-mannose-protein mannosyltransferase
VRIVRRDYRPLTYAPGVIARSDREPPRAAWSPVDTVVLIAITALGGALRLARLDLPKAIMFDETYYAKDACFYLNFSEKVCGVESEQTLVHPPLGKWLIAGGIRLFDYDSFGWRFAAVVAGTITIALLYVVARKLLSSTLGAGMASGLLAVDFLHLVQSRIAMLDIFVPLFGLAAFLFLLFDRDRLLGSEPSAARLGLRRPWRVAAGAAAGMAVASKWSGGLFVVAVIVLGLAWEVGARRRVNQRRALLGALRVEGPSIVVALVLVPVVVYVLSYAGRLHGPTPTCERADGSWTNQLLQHQRCMFDFHHDLEANHSYQSEPWSWLALKRPVSYYFDTAPNGDYKEVLAAGSPFVWWTSTLALLFVAFRWTRRRDFAAPEGTILAGFAFTYLPWLALSSNRSAVFLFYLLPAVPFMCLALGYVASRIGESWEARTATALFGMGAVGLFAFYYPLLADVALPQEQWDKRIWVFDQCERPEPSEPLPTDTTGGRTRTRTTEQTGQNGEDLPPDGWCWI